MLIEPFGEGESLFYGKDQLHHLLNIEQKRTERSNKPFLLLLFDVSALMTEDSNKEILKKIKYALSSSLRESDLCGWFDHNKTIGVICPEIDIINANAIERIIRKIHIRFCEKLLPELVHNISLSFHTYPDTSNRLSVNYPFNVTLYPQITKWDSYKELNHPATETH